MASGTSESSEYLHKLRGDFIFSLEDCGNFCTLLDCLKTNGILNGNASSILRIRDKSERSNKLITLLEEYYFSEPLPASEERRQAISACFTQCNLGELFKAQFLPILLANKRVKLVSPEVISPPPPLTPGISSCTVFSLAESASCPNIHDNNLDESVPSTSGDVMSSSTSSLPAEPPITTLPISVRYNNTVYIDTNNIYKNSSEPRGAVFLVNYLFENNAHHKPRLGSLIDEENLRNLFTDMGYLVSDVHRDLTRVQTKKALRKFRENEVLKKVDCCFIIIMSHGKDSRSFYTADNQIITDKELLDNFNNSACPALVNKPKVFIFQFCRGTRRDDGLPDILKVSAGYGTVETDSAKQGLTDLPAKIPTNTDIIFFYSTVEGFVSFRDTRSGSWFIEELCKVFMDEACESHLEDLLKKVSRTVSQKETPDGCKQSCETRSVGWTKSLYLNPYKKSDFPDMSSLALELPVSRQTFYLPSERQVPYAAYNNYLESPYNSNQSLNSLRTPRGHLRAEGYSPASSTENLPFYNQVVGGYSSRSPRSRPTSGPGRPSGASELSPLMPGGVLFSPGVADKERKKRWSQISDELSFIGQSEVNSSINSLSFAQISNSSGGLDTIANSTMNISVNTTTDTLDGAIITPRPYRDTGMNQSSILYGEVLGHSPPPASDSMTLPEGLEHPLPLGASCLPPAVGGEVGAIGGGLPRGRSLPTTPLDCGTKGELNFKEFRREWVKELPPQQNGGASIKRQLSVDSERELLTNLHKVKTYLQVDDSAEPHLVGYLDKVSKFIARKKDQAKRRKKDNFSQD